MGDWFVVFAGQGGFASGGLWYGRGLSLENKALGCLVLDLMEKLWSKGAWVTVPCCGQYY